MKKTKTKMRVTSLEIFAELIPKLQNREMEVIKAIKVIQPCSDKMLRNYLGWEINQVTGRRNALATYSVIIQDRKDIDKIAPFKRVIFWKLKDYLNQVMVEQ